MRRTLSGLVMAATLCASVAVTPDSAQADNGQIAAGVIGGLAVGTLLGAATAPRPYYYAPAPVYVEPAPVYEAPVCYWARGAPVWDGYRGMWYRPRVQVCD